MNLNSEVLREKGNQIIKNLSIELNFAQYQSAIFEALLLYMQSSKTSKDQNQNLKSLKNIVISNIKLFLKILRELETNNNYEFLTYQFIELYNSYLNLLNESKNVLHEGELLIHMKKLQKICSLYLNYSSKSEQKYEDCIIFLQKLNKVFNWNYSNIKFLVLFKIRKSILIKEYYILKKIHLIKPVASLKM